MLKNFSRNFCLLHLPVLNSTLQYLKCGGYSIFHCADLTFLSILHFSIPRRAVVLGIIISGLANLVFEESLVLNKRRRGAKIRKPALFDRVVRGRSPRSPLGCATDHNQIQTLSKYYTYLIYVSCCTYGSFISQSLFAISDQNDTSE